MKSKVEQSKERSSVHTIHVGVVAMEKEAFRSPSNTVANNDYHQWKYTQWLKILDKAVRISHSSNTFVKGMNPTIIVPAVEK